ncbi:hypothetical protein P154DRAFT_568997 [Amniculicola lignicola CBS 123094]|uniref:Uncharacterized protein n=1 Tax=Amniculicola lignicola CBS 123094 TaxID=1392246 RepID=A0A6A5X5Q8_9PLEO|nr:hypothetical protein P154DRAFT_568997 [Amniculicola lignicola CBS 123094]
MSLFQSEQTKTPDHNSPHLLKLPFELREQIIYQALLAEIIDRSPYPFGTRSLPFERPLLSVFSDGELQYMEKKHWKCSAFWGKEPMTRLMRVNKKLYEEVYTTLWREFSMHLAPMNPKQHEDWVSWLQKHNPRAIQEIRHLHIRLPKIVEYRNNELDSEYRQELAQAEDLRRLKEEVGSYPSLRSVTLQIYLIYTSGPSEKPAARCVKRYLQLIDACENIKAGERLDVKVLYEPDSEAPWGRDIVKACQENIGQRKRTTKLLQWHLESFHS